MKKILAFFKRVIPNKNLSDEDIKTLLFRMGYKTDDEYEFVKYSGNMMTWVYLLVFHVKIKVYGDAYAESEILRYPFNKQEFIKFINENEL